MHGSKLPFDQEDHISIRDAASTWAQKIPADMGDDAQVEERDGAEGRQV